MRALVFERNLARFAASRLAATLGSGRGAGVGPLRLVDQQPPELPGPEWARVSSLLSGICGSDLSTLDGRSSRYFEHVVSFPFVPGHEVVGVVDHAPRTAGDALAPGQRVVLEPVLGCAARAVDPMCPACARGDLGDCERVAFGHLAPGLQTGYCADTGGGWSAAGLVAHASQLHPVPAHFSDEDAVMVEPVACAAHAVLRAAVREDETVAVLGAGTLGLAVVAAATTLAAGGRIPAPAGLLVGARYPHQRRVAEDLGATGAVSPAQLARAVRRRSGSLALGTPARAGQPLTGGADVVLDCVGSSASITQALEMVRPRGRIVLVGMPGAVRVDLASLWHREVALVGAYAYGTEQVAATRRTRRAGTSTRQARDAATSSVRTFDLAFDVVDAHRLGRLVSAAYPVERFEEALAHAGSAGRRGATKIVFDLRGSDRRTPRDKGGAP